MAWSFSNPWFPRSPTHDDYHAGSDRHTSVDRGGVREDRRNPGARTNLYRTGDLQRNVERALLLQELAAASQETSHARQAGGTRTGRERGNHRYWRRLFSGFQDRIAQPSEFYRAVSGRGYRCRRYLA